MIEIIKNPPAPGSDEHTKMFTASKIPTIMGNGYRNSAHPERDLMAQMAGQQTPPAPSDELQALFDRGHELEPAAIEYALKYYLKTYKLRGTQVAYRNTDYPWPHLVTIDAVIEDLFIGPAILEVKTSRTDEVKERYVEQVIFQMGISGIRTAYILVYPNGYGDNFVPVLREVHWNQKRFNRQLEEIERWWEFLKNPAGDNPADHEFNEISQAAAQVAEAKRQLAKAQAAYDMLAAVVLARLQAEGQREWIRDGQVVATVSAGRFSESRLKSAAPDRYKQLVEKYTVTKTVLDSKALKAAEPEVYQAAVGGASLVWKA